MTVAVATPIVQTQMRGYDDPGLPVGTYIAQGAATGDLSGGDLRVDVTYRPESEAVSGRAFNIEQIACHVAGGTNGVSGFIQAQNFGVIRQGTLVTRQWGFVFFSNSGGVQAMAYERIPKLPIFLGQLSNVLALNSAVVVGLDNIDAATLIVTIEGYIWEARSVMALGGLRRPIEALYGQ